MGGRVGVMIKSNMTVLSSIAISAFFITVLSVDWKSNGRLHGPERSLTWTLKVSLPPGLALLLASRALLLC